MGATLGVLPSRAARVLHTAVATALLLAGTAVLPADSVRADQSTTVRVMTFNVFYGGDELDLRTGGWCRRPRGCPETFAKVVEAVERSEADVVALQEPAMHTRRLAEALDWHYDERMHVVSRFPLVDPPGAEGAYVFVEVEPGEVVAIANTHLTAEPYGPYELRDGATPEAVLALEQATRLPEIENHLARLAPVLGEDVPVFFAGDFNSPSHLDWTPATALARDIVVPLAWPVSLALADAGFRDSYRKAHPDPVAKPGFTWTAGGPESVRDEVHDRIDWVLAAGPAHTVDSRIVGEAGGPDVDIVVDPYPTDHRGVVSTFEVAPAAMPVLVAVGARRVEAGDDVEVRFHGRGDRVAIVAQDAPTIELATQLTGGAFDGRLAFGTAELAPGGYEALLLEGEQLRARIPFWVVAPGATPTVWTDKQEYAVGEPIEVIWRDAYGMRLDWVGIYAPGHNHASGQATSCTTYPCANQRYLLFEYLHAEIEGRATFDGGSEPGWGAWPLSPGVYEIRMLLDDHYRSVASSPPFRVVR
jgi:endonuclease/exonuclease/phosphatase family metal-dependent hydrolase